MNLIRKLTRKASQDERGITGLETAIILIAFVVVATVFAFIVLTTGMFSAERGKETVFAGLQKARGTMEVRGGVVVQSTGCSTTCEVDSIQFQVSTSAGGDPIPLDPDATNNATVIAYRSASVVNNDMVYEANEIIGDGDLLLEPGELFTILITATDNASTIEDLAANDRWTLEVQTPVGAVLDLTRSLPAQLDAVMQLH
ncbi:MAG: archaellin/type IV pilin N-terminal domain-containing protein [Dehalococcoidia bacterium]